MTNVITQSRAVVAVIKKGKSNVPAAVLARRLIDKNDAIVFNADDLPASATTLFAAGVADTKNGKTYKIVVTDGVVQAVEL